MTIPLLSIAQPTNSNRLNT